MRASFLGAGVVDDEYLRDFGPDARENRENLVAHAMAGDNDGDAPSIVGVLAVRRSVTRAGPLGRGPIARATDRRLIEMMLQTQGSFATRPEARAALQ